ncbi:probable 2-oxoglutarate-dependent dioxygenase ANS, partial [Hibiscus syriacus]|uniref:probable 2-oxoglutarate-dependent dioxygenase ANS n=1 Tax=Hibiscus syriacus TaxID=106335 RepID=UPI0019229FA5
IFFVSAKMSWPEQVVRVQSLSESGLRAIPVQYIKPLSERPLFKPGSQFHRHVDVPLIDLQHLFGKDPNLHLDTLNRISTACRDWGIFQAVNHGVSHKLMTKARQVWRDFFNLPLQVKQEYANAETTYEGYGSRLGVEKGAVLDWSDYFFLHYLPISLRNQSKWPEQPSSCREVVAQYGCEVVKLCRTLQKAMSIDLGLKEEYIENAFGGDYMGACFRANFYPKCPQPELTLGLSSHSDPGGITILLPDYDVARLQVLNHGDWITVNPVPDSLIVIIGDQIQVVSNAIYNSVEHRVTVNSAKDGVSLAMFFNPKSDLVIEAAEELVSEERPALYEAMTFDHYRVHMRTKGPCGKKRLESLKFNTS